MSATFNELEDAVYDALERRGILSKLKSTIRSHVFSILDDKDLPDLPRPPPEITLIHSLIQEYLEWMGMTATLSVFEEESNIKPNSRLSRSLVAHEIGVDDASSQPLLSSAIYKLKYRGKPYIGSDAMIVLSNENDHNSENTKNMLISKYSTDAPIDTQFSRASYLGSHTHDTECLSTSQTSCIATSVFQSKPMPSYTLDRTTRDSQGSDDENRISHAVKSLLYGRRSSSSEEHQNHKAYPKFMSSNENANSKTITITSTPMTTIIPENKNASTKRAATNRPNHSLQYNASFISTNVSNEDSFKSSESQNTNMDTVVAANQAIQQEMKNTISPRVSTSPTVSTVTLSLLQQSNLSVSNENDIPHDDVPRVSPTRHSTSDDDSYTSFDTRQSSSLHTFNRSTSQSPSRVMERPCSSDARSAPSTTNTSSSSHERIYPEISNAENGKFVSQTQPPTFPKSEQITATVVTTQTNTKIGNYTGNLANELSNTHATSDDTYSDASFATETIDEETQDSYY